MRLLLDEQISPAIAESLRHSGHDVVAIAEQRKMLGTSDESVLVVAAADGQVVVSENVGDFASLGSRRLPNRKPHHGVVLVPRRAFPESSDGFGFLIRALEVLLEERPADDDLLGEVIWLKRAPDDRG